MGVLLVCEEAVGDSFRKGHAGLDAGENQGVEIEGSHDRFLGADVSVANMHFSDEPANALDFLGGTEEDAGAGFVGAGGAAGAVDIHICCSGEVVVDHEVDGGDVETAGCNVGGDKDGG